MNPSIVLCSGEMSGDIHAAALVERLLERVPAAHIRAMGGERCTEAGAELLFHYRDFAILGFTGVLTNLPKLWRLERAMKRAIESADLFIAVDYPGLNLRLAAHAHARGVPVLYYISPQVWAWGAKRLDKIKRTVDRMAVILPFEVDIYEERDIPVEFVGHPFVVGHELPTPLAQNERAGLGLLPGSRVSEVSRVLPIVLGAARRIRESCPELPLTIGKSPAVDMSVYQRAVGETPIAGVPIAINEDAVEVMRTSRALLVASGTATLQSALMETPLAIVYKVSPLNYLMARRVITIPDIGLVNVVLGERVAPEFVQHDAEPAAIAQAALTLLDDTSQRAAMVERFATLREALAGGGGAARVAEMAAELLAS